MIASRVLFFLLLLAVLQAQVVDLKRQDRKNNRPRKKTCKCEHKCGMRHIDPEPQGGATLMQKRIVGGTEAERSSHPWLVRISTGDSSVTNCGGTLLNQQWVLTAAHCVVNQPKSGLLVVLGDHIPSDYEQGEISLVRNIFIHQKYSTKNQSNDIALLKLKQPMEYARNIQPACIPSYDLDKDSPNGYGLVAGWGRLSFVKDEQPGVLHELKLPLLPRDKCRRTTFLHPHMITNNVFCAGEEGKDTCQGDSGGPLVMQKNGNGAFEVHGVVSQGGGCGSHGYPGIYTKVFNYLGWIKNKMKDPCLNCPAKENKTMLRKIKNNC